jgi:hypothetical protein
MPAQFYVVIDESNPDLHRKFGDEEMQEFLIQQTNAEGVLYHTEMIQIKITYNTNTGEVRFVDVEKKGDINFDYTSAYQMQRELVELAIRRLIKLELLAELNKLNDADICRIIQIHHDIDPATGRIRSNTSEILLDMTIVKIVKLGYSREALWQRVFFRWMKRRQTQIQKAIYTAFEEFKKISGNSSQVLEEFKSKHSLQKFMDMIQKYL